MAAEDGSLRRVSGGYARCRSATIRSAPRPSHAAGIGGTARLMICPNTRFDHLLCAGGKAPDDWQRRVLMPSPPLGLAIGRRHRAVLLRRRRYRSASNFCYTRARSPCSGSLGSCRLPQNGGMAALLRQLRQYKSPVDHRIRSGGSGRRLATPLSLSRRTR